MANQPNSLAAHWLEMRVRISPKLWTCCPYCMLLCGGTAKGRSNVKSSPTESDVLMNVIKWNNNLLQLRMCWTYTCNV